MQRKLLLALATAGMIAAPLAAQAAHVDDGKIVVAQAAGGGAGGGAAGGAGGAAGGAGGGAAGGGGSGDAGGSDGNNSIRAEGSNPPGTISPGAPSDAASAADAQTGAIGRTNPNQNEGRAGAGSSRDTTLGSPSTDENSPTTSPYSR